MIPRESPELRTISAPVHQEVKLREETESAKIRKKSQKTREREQSPDSNFFQLTVGVVPRVCQRQTAPKRRNARMGIKALHVVSETKAEGETREEHGI